jgi:cell division protein FtsI (penicillin-binding protein 3)
MATAPGYDNNQAHLKRNMGLWSNQAAQTVYEPGSTFKVVTFSAALSAGVVWPGEVLHNVPDFLNFGDKVIHDDTSHKPWDISVRHILKISSNIGTDEIAQMVGEQGLMQWIRRYGFGRETALRFPGESPGIVLPGRDWTESSIGTIPIGQGIGVTAMQMASMYQAIANGGVMVEPHIVQQIQGRRPPRRWQRRVLSTASWCPCSRGSSISAAPVPRRPSPDIRSPARPAPPRSQTARAATRTSTTRRSSAFSRPRTPRSRS